MITVTFRDETKKTYPEATQVVNEGYWLRLSDDSENFVALLYPSRVVEVYKRQAVEDKRQAAS